MESKYEALKLENQLCFPLYACAKEIVRRYKPLLDKLDLTYTQYLVMMVLWERGSLTVKELGQKLYLDSGTLTPVLKTLESKRYLTRARLQSDERNLLVTLTDTGAALREKALSVPYDLGSCVRVSREEAQTLYRTLYKILNGFSESEE